MNNNISIPTLNPYLNGNDIQKFSISEHSLILLSKELNLNFLFFKNLIKHIFLIFINLISIF